MTQRAKYLTAPYLHTAKPHNWLQTFRDLEVWHRHRGNYDEAAWLNDRVCQLERMGAS